MPQSKSERYVSGFLSVIFVVVCCYYLATLVTFIFTGASVPANTDDIPYDSGAKVFAEINSVKARTINEESVAKFFESDWYGFIYPIFYGTIYKIFSSDARVLVFVNFVSIVAMLILSFRLFKEKRAIFFSMLAFLFSSNVLYFIYRYMPPCLTALQGFTLFYFLYRYTNETDKILQRKQLILFIVLTLCFSLFRNYFIFFLAGLIPLATTRKEIIKFSIFLIIGFLLSSLYLKYFTAISLQSFRDIDHGGVQKIFLNFTSQAGHNVQVVIGTLLHFFTLDWQILILPYIITGVIPIITLLIFFKTKNKLALSYAFITLFSYAFFFAFYPIEGDFFLRHSLHFLFPFLFIFFSVPKFMKLKYVLLTLFLISFLQITFSNAIFKSISYGNRLYQRIHGEQLFVETNNIKNFVKDENRKLTTILIDRDLYNQYGKHILASSIPFVSSNKKLIRYTSNPFVSSGSLEQFGKVNVDLILTQKINRDYDQYIILENNFFKLCYNPQSVSVVH